MLTLRNYFCSQFITIMTMASCGLSSGPKLSLDPNVIDLGKVHVNSAIKKTIQVENSGNQELIIKNINPGCRCTDVSITSKNLRAGETAQLSITYHPDSTAEDRTKIATSIVIESNSESIFNDVQIIGVNVR